MTAEAAPLVVDLRRPEGARRELLGTKLTRLIELRALGIDVPSGFALTTAALDLVRRSAPTGPRWPAALEAAFAEHLERLQVQAGSERFVVRTSALEEDLADASFAGQYDSFLGVRGAAAIRAAIAACWRSLDGDRVAAYRRARGIDGRARGAVAVMPQIRADLAGVAFSVDPVRGSRERVVVEIGRDTPADVSDGVGRPAVVELDKHDGRTLTSTGGADVPDARETAAILAHVLRIEQAFGAPVDVEWGLVRTGGEPRFVVFQVRPVTALPSGPPAWDPARYAARFAQPE